MSAETGLIHMDASPLPVAALPSQMAATIMSAFDIQNLEETQMLQKELHRERASTKADNMWHSSSGSLVKSRQSFPQDPLSHKALSLFKSQSQV